MWCGDIATEREWVSASVLPSSAERSFMAQQSGWFAVLMGVSSLAVLLLLKVLQDRASQPIAIAGVAWLAVASAVLSFGRALHSRGSSVVAWRFEDPVRRIYANATSEDQIEWRGTGERLSVVEQQPRGSWQLVSHDLLLLHSMHLWIAADRQFWWLTESHRLAARATLALLRLGADGVLSFVSTHRRRWVQHGCGIPAIRFGSVSVQVRAIEGVHQPIHRLERAICAALSSVNGVVSTTVVQPGSYRSPDQPERSQKLWGVIELLSVLAAEGAKRGSTPIMENVRLLASEPLDESTPRTVGDFDEANFAQDLELARAIWDPIVDRFE